MEKIVTEFLKEILGETLPNWLLQVIIYVTLIILGAFMPYLYRHRDNFIRLFKKKKVYKNLGNIFNRNYKEIKQIFKTYITTRIEHKNPVEVHKYNVELRKSAINIFIKEFRSEQRSFFFVLGDSGFGKSTFLMYLYYYYSTNYVKNKDILLIPFKKNIDIIEEIKVIDNKANTILLLDGFDEDETAFQNYNKRLDSLAEYIIQFNTVIITARTHFFPNLEEQPNKINFPDYLKKKEYRYGTFYISPFDNSDIELYIRKVFPRSLHNVRIQNRKRKEARDLVNRYSDVMFRPMLLSEIESILQANKGYTFDFEIYNHLIDIWTKREYPIMEQKQKDIIKAMSELVIIMYTLKDERNGHFFLTNSEINDYAISKNSQLNEEEIRTKTFLTRTDYAQYKFSHHSIFEFFIAKELYNNKLTGFDYSSFESLGFTKKIYWELKLRDYMNSDKFEDDTKRLFNSVSNQEKRKIIDDIFKAYSTLPKKEPNFSNTEFKTAIKTINK